MKKYFASVVAFLAMVVGAVKAFAGTFTITQPTFDYAQLGTYAGTILAALACIWVIRKFIKMTNRS
jgi:hypothetical protein